MPLKVNLLPKEDLGKKPLGEFLKWILTYGRYIIISVELIVLIVFFSRFVYDRQLTDLNESIEQKQAIVLSASDIDKNVRSVQKGLERINTIEDGRLLYFNILEKLKTIIPYEVALERISFKEKKISFSGKARSNSSFAQFLSTLKKTKEFSQIDLTELRKQEKNNLILFQITANITSNNK